MVGNITDDKAKQPRARRKRKSQAYKMAKWKAWSLIGAVGFLGVFLLWLGQVIAVTAERVGETQVDVTVERRFLGLLTLGSETIRDVVEADVYYIFARTSSGGKTKRGGTQALRLYPRDGEPVIRRQFGPSIGTLPPDMAPQITAFLAAPTAVPFTSWWMPWLVNIAAIPFILIAVCGDRGSGAEQVPCRTQGGLTGAPNFRFRLSAANSPLFRGLPTLAARRPRRTASSPRRTCPGRSR